MPKTIAPASRTRRKLTRGRILTVALELVDLDGLEALTMRRLADQLKVDPMSLYNHVDGKEALLDGIAEALWNEVELPDGEVGWMEALRSFATSLRAMVHAHPQAYPLLMTRGILSARELHAIDGAIQALERAGLSREQAAEMIRTLFAYAVGYGMLELSTPPPAGATSTEQIVNLTRALPNDAPFHLVEVARLVCDCDMDYQFNLGLDLIVSGLEARLP
ncbi:MAG TPA: TetR/AcrR family transcriptional regulator C-terminal domain-containing protein [Candidatus Dormibacteraeota bacterium]|nr:TetR/AcrR family transcriptional regulator C-terminal domain-containing protein [Candidatus Dormibacteraeota bacterium]